MTPEEMKEIQKQAIKEGIKEWMDQQYQKFGKWALGMFFSAVFFALIYFILTTNGWHKN